MPEIKDQPNQVPVQQTPAQPTETPQAIQPQAEPTATINQDHHLLAKDEIKRSKLNQISLENIEQEYSEKSKQAHKSKFNLSELQIKLIAVMATFLVLIFIGIAGRLMFKTLFSRTIQTPFESQEVIEPLPTEDEFPPVNQPQPEPEIVEPL